MCSTLGWGLWGSNWGCASWSCLFGTGDKRDHTGFFICICWQAMGGSQYLLGSGRSSVRQGGWTLSGTTWVSADLARPHLGALIGKTMTPGESSSCHCGGWLGWWRGSAVMTGMTGHNWVGAHLWAWCLGFLLEYPLSLQKLGWRLCFGGPGYEYPVICRPVQGISVSPFVGVGEVWEICLKVEEWGQRCTVWDVQPAFDEGGGSYLEFGALLTDLKALGLSSALETIKIGTLGHFTNRSTASLHALLSNLRKSQVHRFLLDLS